MPWTKAESDHWVCLVPPGARFTLEATPKGDGRWSWQVSCAGARSPMATGIANTLSAAKNASERFLKGAGYT